MPAHNPTRYLPPVGGIFRLKRFHSFQEFGMEMLEIVLIDDLIGALGERIIFDIFMSHKAHNLSGLNLSFLL
jgi:hypothetical protein